MIGFGEVGQVLAADLRAAGQEQIAAFDLQFADPASAPSRALNDAGVQAGRSAADALADSRLVICAVTAVECVAAATTAAAAAITAGGGRYVEAAIMAPIAPARIASPMLLGGPHAGAFLRDARELGFRGASVFSDLIGQASAAKMCRNVIVKGVEALLAESLLAARRYGVEDAVLDSLGALLPVGDWRSLSRYMIGRARNDRQGIEARGL